MKAIKKFLVNYVFVDGNFDHPQRLGLATFAGNNAHYEMRAVWGQYSLLEHVRRDISAWKRLPATYPALYNGLLDLSKSWLEKSNYSEVWETVSKE